MSYVRNTPPGWRVIGEVCPHPIDDPEGYKKYQQETKAYLDHITSTPQIYRESFVDISSLTISNPFRHTQVRITAINNEYHLVDVNYNITEYDILLTFSGLFSGIIQITG